MVENAKFYELTAIAVLAIWNIYFFFSLLYVGLKKSRLTLLIILVLSAVTIRIYFTNQVYIIDDSNNIERRILVIPHKFLLHNGKYTILKPEPSLSQIWIINNGAKPLYFESIIYGEKGDLTLKKRTIVPYSSDTTAKVDYLFIAPPEKIKAINPPVTRGWLHR